MAPIITLVLLFTTCACRLGTAAPFPPPVPVPVPVPVPDPANSGVTSPAHAIGQSPLNQSPGHQTPTGGRHLDHSASMVPVPHSFQNDAPMIAHGAGPGPGPMPMGQPLPGQYESHGPTSHPEPIQLGHPVPGQYETHGPPSHPWGQVGPHPGGPTIPWPWSPHPAPPPSARPYRRTSDSTLARIHESCSRGFDVAHGRCAEHAMNVARFSDHANVHQTYPPLPGQSEQDRGYHIVANQAESEHHRRSFFAAAQIRDSMAEGRDAAAQELMIRRNSSRGSQPIQRPRIASERQRPRGMSEGARPGHSGGRGGSGSAASESSTVSRSRRSGNRRATHRAIRAAMK